MPWSAGTFTRSDGVYSGATVWLQNKNAGVKIVTDRADTHDQDIATGINTCLTKDGQNTATANLPMGGFRHTGVGTAQSTDQYAAASQVANNSMQWCGTATSTAGTMFSISNTFSGTSLTIGQRFQFIGTQASTASTYISVAGAGSALLCPADGTSALATGGVGIGELIDIAYSNLAGGIFQKLNAKTNEVVNTITVGSGGTLSGTYAGNPTFSGTVNVGTATVGTIGFTVATGSSVTGTTASFSGSANVGTIGGTMAAFSGSVSVGTLGVSGSASVTGALSAGTLTGTFAGNPVLSGTVNMALMTGTVGSSVVATTQSAGDNSTKIATTAYVNALGSATSFTPALKFGGANVGMTTSAASGSYSQIGKIVTFWLHITLTAKGSSTGSATITGLPVDPATIQGCQFAYYSGMASVGNIVAGYVQVGSIALDSGAATAVSALTHANFTDTTEIYLSGSYLAA